jgi:hypothetical protein
VAAAVALVVAADFPDAVAAEAVVPARPVAVGADAVAAAWAKAS